MMQCITPQFYTAISQLAEVAHAKMNFLEMKHRNLAACLRLGAIGFWVEGGAIFCVLLEIGVISRQSSESPPSNVDSPL